MTLEEAIAHSLEVAEQNEAEADWIDRRLIGSTTDKYATDCRECAADHRQLAEWLTEMKEAKRLLKVMYEDIKRYAGGMCRVCTECTADFECKCEDFCATNKRSKWKYKYEPEILALIGEEGGNNA